MLFGFGRPQPVSISMIRSCPTRLPALAILFNFILIIVVPVVVPVVVVAAAAAVVAVCVVSGASCCFRALL